MKHGKALVALWYALITGAGTAVLSSFVGMDKRNGFLIGMIVSLCYSLVELARLPQD